MRAVCVVDAREGGGGKVGHAKPQGYMYVHIYIWIVCVCARLPTLMLVVPRSGHAVEV